MKSRSRYALATVTTERFLPGTATMLQSFLRLTPSMRMDLVVFCDELSPAIEAELAGFPRLRLLPISESLSQSVTRLVEAVPRLTPRKARFYSLDVFGLDEYDRVLFCDSDVLFVEDVSELFQSDNELCACGERTWYTDQTRDPQTHRILDKASHATEAPPAFNAGLLSIGKPLLNKTVKQRLLDEMTPELWQSGQAHHTDQLILNRVFADRIHILPAPYNFLLLHHDAILRKENTTVDQAKVIHFNGAPKPWETGEAMRKAAQDPAWRQAFAKWQQVYQSINRPESSLLARA